jgi:hypothetical protein
VGKAPIRAGFCEVSCKLFSMVFLGINLVLKDSKY